MNYKDFLDTCMAAIEESFGSCDEFLNSLLLPNAPLELAIIADRLHCKFLREGVPNASPFSEAQMTVRMLAYIGALNKRYEDFTLLLPQARQ